MGWLFSESWRTRADMLAHLRRPERFAPSCQLLKSSAVGNNHWYLAKNLETGVVWIGLDLMKGSKPGYPGWGYKDLDETMGPCEVNCPITYLDLASPTGPDDGYAYEWRGRVRAHHAAKKARPKPAPEQVVEFGGKRYRLVRPMSNPRRGWLVRGEADGYEYRMCTRYLARAAVVA